MTPQNGPRRGWVPARILGYEERPGPSLPGFGPDKGTPPHSLPQAEFLNRGAARFFKPRPKIPTLRPSLGSSKVSLEINFGLHPVLIITDHIGRYIRQVHHLSERNASCIYLSYTSRSTCPGVAH